MVGGKLDRRLLEEMTRVEAAGGDRPIPVVLQCLAPAPGTGLESGEEKLRVTFQQLRDRLTELGAVGLVREIPHSNALEAQLTPAQIYAAAAHPVVGRVVLSRRDSAEERAASAGRAVSPPPGPEELIGLLSKRVVGQSAAMKAIVPCILMHQAGLAPEGRPVGVFLLLGPTGTGKTRTVEALAEALHGSERMIVRIDCGEFQGEHEVAKLIGAPPGYIGHRDTVPMISQRRLDEVTTDRSDLAIVLFDEIEKAAPTLTRLLLGVLDRATLRLGDNSTVNFEKALIFLTSNLGAREMMKELTPGVGFAPGRDRPAGEISSRLESIALAAVRKSFSPEFVNRLDGVVTYEPLGADALATILDQQIDALQQHVNTRLGSGGFTVEVAEPSRQFQQRLGTSVEHGARELRRTVHRHLTQPMAALVASGRVEPGATVHAEMDPAGERVVLRVEEPAITAEHRRNILVVDDNQDLLELLRDMLVEAGWEVQVAATAREARAALAAAVPSVALIDYLLPDDSGLDLATEVRRRTPTVHVVVMSGLDLSGEDEAICQEAGCALLTKPFRSDDVLGMLRRVQSARAVGSG
jgi:DNA-binding NtrC family response regulator